MLSNMTPIVEGKVQDCCYVAFSESQYLTKGNEGWRLGDYHTFSWFVMLEQVPRRYHTWRRAERGGEICKRRGTTRLQFT